MTPAEGGWDAKPPARREDGARRRAGRPRLATSGRRARPLFERLAALCLALILALFGGAGAVRAQDAPAPFKAEEIEALVAPIALYPDSLLSQVLMASTYPLEIVQAARWAKANPSVKGEAAVKAVEGQPWDISVKSLTAFPQVLEPMNEKLDWTQKLGDAFLAQKEDVLAAVQRLRARAEQAGNLKSSDQQKVTVEAAPAGAVQQTIVRIEPASPQVIYVPAYNPTVVYGSWGYPSYPPYYWPPPPAYYPGAALASGFAWGVGLAAAGAIYSNCNWGGQDVDIDIDRAVNIDRSFDRTKVQNGRWQHDASHRQGVAYRDGATRQKYVRNTSGAEGRANYRGREGAGGGAAAERTASAQRGALGDRTGAGNRGTADGASDRTARADRGGAEQRTGADRSAAVANRGTGADRGAAGRQGGGSPGADRGGLAARDNAFQGVGGGAAAQRDVDRGRASAQSSGAGRAGGGARGAGGHGGGGRGGGRR